MVDWSKYPHFSEGEFRCRCGCKQVKVDERLLDLLQTIRYACGPMSISSGYRCKDHPEEKKKTKPGAHSYGMAADILCSAAGQRHRIVSEAIKAGVMGVGVSSSFVHLDVGNPSAVRPAMWSY